MLTLKTKFYFLKKRYPLISRDILIKAIQTRNKSESVCYGYKQTTWSKGPIYYHAIGTDPFFLSNIISLPSCEQLTQRISITEGYFFFKIYKDDDVFWIQNPVPGPRLIIDVTQEGGGVKREDTNRQFCMSRP